MQTKNSNRSLIFGIILLTVIFSVTYFVMYKYSQLFTYEFNVAIEFFGFALLSVACTFINLPFLPLILAVLGSVGLGIYETDFLGLFAPQLFFIICVKCENKKNTAEKTEFYISLSLLAITLISCVYSLIKQGNAFPVYNKDYFLPRIFLTLAVIINIFAFIQSFKIKPEKKSKKQTSNEDSYHNMFILSAVISVLQCVFMWRTLTNGSAWGVVISWALTYMFCILLKDRVFYGIYKKAVKR